MERIVRGENVLLGHKNNPQRSFENLPKSPNSNSDMDFSDVFGGPTRRFSIQEVRMRCSFNETREFEDEAVLPRSPWSGFDEKPVFGAESCNRRQHPSDDFFDDIFGGDECKFYSSPRRNNQDSFLSNPGSQVLSPARILPPKAEPFSISLPAQFSLPAKLKKAIGFPVCASENHSLYRSKDGISNGISYAYASSISLSRFSSQGSEFLNETRISNSFHDQCPSSRKVSLSSEESALETKSGVKDGEDKLQNDSGSMEAPTNINQFHFSIYKWAGKGVSLLMPSMAGNRLRSKERSKIEKSSSTNGRIQFDRFNREMQVVEDHIVSVANESVSSNIKDGNPVGSAEVTKMDYKAKETKMESHKLVKETHPDISDSKYPETTGQAVPFGQAISSQKKAGNSDCNHEVDLCEKTGDEIYINKKQGPKPELKPILAFPDDKSQGQGDATEGEESTVKFTNVANKNANCIYSAKQDSGKQNNSSQAAVTTDSSQSSSTKLGDAPGKSGAKGKVREFVKMFNQEASAKSKANFDIPSQSSRWKGIDINGKENEIRNASNKEERAHMHNKKKMPDASFKEDIHLKTDQQDQCSKWSDDKTRSLFTNEKNAPLFSDSLPEYAEVKVENRDESFQGHFLVLWPGSGWKPVPLVDIIEGSAVKRAYQKALLSLHPDKLQQKAAGTDQKYIAEKAFDILQEAWDHFNSLGAI